MTYEVELWLDHLSKQYSEKNMCTFLWDHLDYLADFKGYLTCIEKILCNYNYGEGMLRWHAPCISDLLIHT